MMGERWFMLLLACCLLAGVSAFSSLQTSQPAFLSASSRGHTTRQHLLHAATSPSLRNRRRTTTGLAMIDPGALGEFAVPSIIYFGSVAASIAATLDTSSSSSKVSVRQALETAVNAETVTAPASSEQERATGAAPRLESSEDIPKPAVAEQPIEVATSTPEVIKAVEKLNGSREKPQADKEATGEVAAVPAGSRRRRLAIRIAKKAIAPWRKWESISC